MNVYDFDKTVFRRDSTAEFFGYLILHHPSLVRFLPKIAFYGVCLALKLKDKTACKEKFYSLYSGVSDIESEVRSFWEAKKGGLKKWYLDTKRDDDVIISASPEFLLKPICEELGVCLIASKVDPKTGKYDGRNCHGEEKVLRFRAVFPDSEAEKFFSDSDSDLPMARISRAAFKVSGDRVTEWNVR